MESAIPNDLREELANTQHRRTYLTTCVTSVSNVSERSRRHQYLESERDGTEIEVAARARRDRRCSSPRKTQLRWLGSCHTNWMRSTMRDRRALHGNECERPAATPGAATRRVR